MKNYTTIFAVIIFALAFLGSVKADKFKTERVLIGRSTKVFQKNSPQDFCAIFGKKSGVRQANGTQIFTGVCSNTPQGNLPTIDNMPSTLILSPRNNQRIKANKPFNITTKTTNFELGFFSDATITYNAFPQELNDDGKIKGHQHVTVQFLGKHGDQFPDAQTFDFFKGLNSPADKKGHLSVAVENGLEKPGIYRCCTILSSFSHQYVVLPKAQRGASDDCVRFEIIDM